MRNCLFDFDTYEWLGQVLGPESDKPSVNAFEPLGRAKDIRHRDRRNGSFGKKGSV